MNWNLVIVMPQVTTMLYLDSLHKFIEPNKLLFMNFYCLTRRIQQINCDYLLCEEVYQQKTDEVCGMFRCLNAYYFLNGYSIKQDQDSLVVRYWMAYQCNRFILELQRIKRKIEFDENEFFEILSFSRDIEIKNFSSPISLHQNIIDCRIRKGF